MYVCSATIEDFKCQMSDVTAGRIFLFALAGTVAFYMPRIIALDSESIIESSKRKYIIVRQDLASSRDTYGAEATR